MPTKNYYSIRVHDPEQFNRHFITVRDYRKIKGLNAVVGFLPHGNTLVQSLRFKKDMWDDAGIRSWYSQYKNAVQKWVGFET